MQEVSEATSTASAKNHWSTAGIFWLLMVAVVSFAQAILVPIIMAFLIALIFSPFRRTLIKVGVPNTISGSVLVALIIASLTYGFFTVAETVQATLVDAPYVLPEVIEKLKGLSGAIAPALEASEQIAEITNKVDTPQAVKIAEPEIMSLLAQTTPIILGQFLLCMALTVFLISSGDLFYEKLIEIIPKLNDFPRTFVWNKHRLPHQVLSAGSGLSEISTVETDVWLSRPKTEYLEVQTLGQSSGYQMTLLILPEH